MAQTKFLEYFDGFDLVLNIFRQNLIDGKREGQPYYHKLLFKPEYSVDGKWRSMTGDSNRVTADFVALDSRLPLKKRDTVKKAEDEIPKMGMKKYLNENQMRQIQLLELTDRFEEVRDVLYNDSFKVVTGVEEMNEYLALQAVSNGAILVPDANKVGLGMRVSFGVNEDNRFGVASSWKDDANADIIEDIERMVEHARDEGYTIRYIHMNKATSKLVLKNNIVKQYYGDYLNFIGTNIPRPNLEQLNSALAGDKGYQINVIDRTVKFERDGVREVKDCWADGMVVGTVDLSLGKLIYTDLAEERFPDEDVVYQKVGSYTLVSRWHENDPIREYTSSQAACLPVLQDMDSLFYLNSEDAQTSTDAQTEGDANISISGNTVTRDALITALKNVGVTKANSRNSDTTLQEYYNDLTAENEALVNTELGI